MTIEPTHGAFVARQSLSSRFWRALGFGMTGGMEMADWRCDESDKKFAPGAIMTDTVIVVDFMDRLRLLISGKARVEVSTKTDVMVNRTQSRSRFGVLAPGTPLERKYFQ